MLLDVNLHRSQILNGIYKGGNMFENLNSQSEKRIGSKAQRLREISNVVSRDIIIPKSLIINEDGYENLSKVKVSKLLIDGTDKARGLIQGNCAKLKTSMQLVDLYADNSKDLQ